MHFIEACRFNSFIEEILAIAIKCSAYNMSNYLSIYLPTVGVNSFLVVNFVFTAPKHGVFV